jgi:uncharacterized membrane protein
MEDKDKLISTESILHEQTGGSGISLFARLRGYFLAGILVTAPIGITFYLTWTFVKFIDSSVSNLIPEKYYPETAVPGIGLLIAVSGFVLIGWFAKNFLGRLIIRLSEYIVHRMPVIRNLYGAIKQIIETIMASQSQAFRDVVILEYPRKGVYSVGFVTGRSRGEIQRVITDETVNVFVPTIPNPTSGYLLFVPRKELHFLDMTVEEGVKLVISGGIITPPDRGAPEDTDTLDSPESKKAVASKSGTGKKTGSKSAGKKKET